MDEKNYTGAVPENYRGDSITAECFREFENTDAARACFRESAMKLMDVDHWHEWATEMLGRFVISDVFGNPVGGTAREGLLIRINIPGPGSSSGKGYDWVRIEEIARMASGTVESLAMRVRPVSAPGSDEKEPAHFYDSQSTSTFTLTRENAVVTAAIYDRNIVSNTTPESLIDKLRNAIAGFFGKKAFSKIQWQVLVEGLLKVRG
ncbi:hypothetical protein GCM10010967_43140 [Dyadobacter beijingensis]|uniref:Uncharacterized protein n=1 Tax=Dyadobacter beijingensis TaxID=365489 RepID=A0ABQ2ICV5_9BACT|nr:hypothetical protein [Dyadobacter beijingensis]GGN03695.1 hypothetical protein GCM10010967_43140 [Dyadobacter beijingensis]